MKFIAVLFVRVGNCRTRELLTLFQQHLPAIAQALESSSLVELDRQNVQVIA